MKTFTIGLCSLLIMLGNCTSDDKEATTGKFLESSITKFVGEQVVVSGKLQMQAGYQEDLKLLKN